MTGGRKADKALQAWTSWMATIFVALLVSDLVTEGFTADHLIARLVVFGVGWFAGMLVIRRRARRATDGPDGPDGPDDAGS